MEYLDRFNAAFSENRISLLNEASDNMGREILSALVNWREQNRGIYFAAPAWP